MNRDKDINQKKEKDDKVVISSKNLIPNKRDVTRADVDAFIESVKKSRQEEKKDI